MIQGRIKSCCSAINYYCLVKLESHCADVEWSKRPYLIKEFIAHTHTHTHTQTHTCTHTHTHTQTHTGTQTHTRLPCSTFYTTTCFSEDGRACVLLEELGGRLHAERQYTCDDRVLPSTLAFVAWFLFSRGHQYLMSHNSPSWIRLFLPQSERESTKLSNNQSAQTRQSLVKKWLEREFKEEGFWLLRNKQNNEMIMTWRDEETKQSEKVTKGRRERKSERLRESESQRDHIITESWW